MAKSVNQKLKLLYIVKILKEKTDEEHAISTNALIDELAKYEIKAERKSIYDDIDQLIDFGFDIEKNKGKSNGGYSLLSREFEVPELKVLVDTVQSSRFITLKKSRELIGKLEELASVNDAKKLQRQVFVANRIKTDNESIYYNVDYIHRAIQDNQKIRFKYFDWSLKKEMQFKKNGEYYQISPFHLAFNDGNYYLIGYDEKAKDKVRHYRVDKMTNMEVKNEKREGNETFKNFDVASYCNKIFGMFAGKDEDLTLVCENKLSGVMIDRFGKDVTLQDLKDGHFLVRTKISVSPQFFGWLAGLGDGIQIAAPKEVKEDYKKYLLSLVENIS